MPIDPTVADERVTLETAAEHASARVPVFAPGDRAGQVRRQLNGQQYECASHVVVCEDRMFRGVVRVERGFSSLAPRRK